MAVFPAAAAAFAASEAGRMLRDGADVIQTGEPSYIRDGDPQSITGKIGQASARLACRQFAADPGRVPVDRQLAYDKACRPYLEDIGQYDSPGVVKPFDGGQCPGVLYLVTYESQTANGQQTACNQPVTTQIGQVDELIGPIQGITNTPGAIGPGGNTPVIFGNLIHAGGARGLGSVLSTGCSTAGYRMVSVVPRTGQPPDNCGNPPPEFDQGDDQPDPTNPEPFNPGPDIDIDIGVEINIDGSIDIDLGGGPITIDPFGDDDSEGGGGPPETPGGSGDEGASGETGAGGEEEGEDEGRILVGVRVEILGFPSGANTRIRGGEQLFISPYVVYMGGDAGLQQSESDQFVTANDFHYAPEQANRYRVLAAFGYNLRVTPFWREPEE